MTQELDMEPIIDFDHDDIQNLNDIDERLGHFLDSFQDRPIVLEPIPINLSAMRVVNEVHIKESDIKFPSFSLSELFSDTKAFTSQNETRCDTPKADGVPSTHKTDFNGDDLNLEYDLAISRSLALNDRSESPLIVDLPSSFSRDSRLSRLNISAAVSSSSDSSRSSSPTIESIEQGPDRWNDRYAELKLFVRKHGHCHIPMSWDENPVLAKWAKRQRYQYKLKQEGKRSALYDLRQTMLEDLGFLWDVRSTLWDTRYRELRSFHRKYGHCNVAIGNTEFPKLGTWVKCQRRQFALLQNGKKSNMTTERVQLLSALGFAWHGR
jgi:hypothetical protein